MASVLSFTPNKVTEQIIAAGYLPYFISIETWVSEEGEHKAKGRVDIGLIDLLHRDVEFETGPWHLLHDSVPEPRCEFRSHRGYFGKGSLQIVICEVDGQFEADVDSHSPYDDLVGVVAHNAVVVKNLGKRLWKKLTRKKA